MSYCLKHPNVKPATFCPACRGEKNAGVTSPSKAEASARNGHLGGRPRLPRHTPACDATVTGGYTADCPRCQYDARRIA